MFGDEFFDEFKRMRKEIDRVLGHVFQGLSGKTTKALSKGKWKMPSCDVCETGTSIIAAIELPGVDKKNIDLRVNGNNLEVYAKTGQKKEAVKKGQYVASASAQEYYQVLPFPAPVQAGKAKASYKNGVLCVEVPKARGAQSNRIMIE